MTIDIDFSPIKVDIQVEDLQLQSDAFYTVCFIAESDTAPRTLEVTQLSQLLDAGYMRAGNVYNFVHSVFAQGGKSGVINDEIITYVPSGKGQQHCIRYIVEFETQVR